MIPHPVEDQRHDLVPALPERSQRLDHGGFQVFQRREGPMAQRVPELIPQALHRVEFGAVRRQGQPMNPDRQARTLSARMKAGAEVQTHQRHQPKLALALHDLHRSIRVCPLIPMLARYHHPLPPQSPAPPRECVPPHPAFIRHPHPDRTARRQRQGLQLIHQVRTKLRRGRRGLVCGGRGAAPGAPRRLFPTSNTASWPPV